MLETPRKPPSFSSYPDSTADLDERIGMSEILAFVRRSAVLLVVGVVTGLTLGWLYSQSATPIYVARAKILLEKPKVYGAGADIGLVQFTLDTSQIESQIQVIEAEATLRAVVQESGLLGDRELLGAKPSWLRRFYDWLGVDALPGSSTPVDDSAPALAHVLAVLDDRLGARRIGQSYVIEITFWSEDPSKAAQIVNSVAAAYVRNQIAAKKEIAESGSELIAKEILKLQLQVAVASEAVRSGKIDVQSFPSADARVITAAAPPLGRSWPRTNLVASLGALLGLFAALVLAALRGRKQNRLMR